MEQSTLFIMATILMLCCCSSSMAAIAYPALSSEGGAAGPSAPGGGTTLPKARYVTLTFHEGAPSKYVLTPYEIKVFDKSGTNIALNGSISDVGEQHDESRFPRGAVIDGDETTIWHSKHSGATDFITIDLGADKEISKIQVLNVTGTTVYNGVETRARMSGGGSDSSDKGAYIELKNTAGSVVKTTPDIKTVAATYTIDFSAATPAWQ